MQSNLRGFLRTNRQWQFSLPMGSKDQFHPTETTWCFVSQASASARKAHWSSTRRRSTTRRESSSATSARKASPSSTPWSHTSRQSM